MVHTVLEYVSGQFEVTVGSYSQEHHVSGQQTGRHPTPSPHREEGEGEGGGIHRDDWRSFWIF